MIKRILLITLALLIWTVFTGLGIVQGFLLRPITSEDSSQAFVEVSKEKIDETFVGNLAMTIIENGEIAEKYFYSIDQAVDEFSVFPVASISKWVTSFGVMKLVEKGRIDLDTPVETYLTRWNLPPGDFDNKKVTVRRLLSHSAGLVDNLGYGGFESEEEVQTIEESLADPADGYEGAARLGYEPGSQYQYSGASYTILQLLIEEVTGQSFQEYMRNEVFEPLGMDNSTFDLNKNPSIKLAQLYTDKGSLSTPNRFTALAAAGLFTCTNDLAKFVLANINANSVLSVATIDSMSQAVSFIHETPVYGLGPHLFSQHDTNSKIIGHDGSGGRLAINSAARIDLHSGDGIIVLGMGNYRIPSAIADEWIYWKFGIADYIVIQRNKTFIITLLLAGYLCIGLTSIYLVRRIKQKTSTAN